MNPMPELIPMLKQLRLSGILDSIESRNRQAIENKFSYMDFLATIVTLHINLMSIFHICLMFCKNIIGIGFMGHLVSDRSYPQPSFRPPCFVPGLRSVVGHG